MDLEKITHDDCLFDVDEAAWLRIVSKRGGCRCCISPPCAACTEPVTEDELNSVGYTYEAPPARFPEVSCSQCGQGFGPGDSGFSHCMDHAERDSLRAVNAELLEALEDAATSLETISRLAGKANYGVDENGPIPTYMGRHDEVRGYAGSRAGVARAAIASARKQKGEA